MAQCMRDTELAGKVFFPERFWRPFDKLMHGRIFDLIDNSDNPQKAIAAPRGLGKTSIVNMLLPIKAIMFAQSRYIVPVSCTSDLAMQQAENLKAELINNPLIQKIYGSLASENFSKRQWVVQVGSKDICVMPRGAGQQIRGLLYRDHRPGLILVDDLEDPENMDNEEQRRKKKKWFYADLLNAVDRGLGGKWEIIVLGTILHQDSLLQDLLNNDDWDSVRLELCDDDLNSYCPNFMPTPEVHKLYKKYKNAEELDVFYREFKNNPVPVGEDATFPQSLFRDYDPGEVRLSNNPNVENMVLVDPAKTANPKSAHSAIVGIAVDLRKNTMYFRDIVDAKLHYNELIDEIVDMVVRIQARVLGIEVTSLHEFITYPIKNELLRRGIHVEVVELHARGGSDEKGKTKRIKSLAPFYRQGQILHNPSCCKVLEQQLMSFPFAKRWDVMDAAGYLPEMLEIGERYMYHNTEEEDSFETVEAEYMELDEDESLEVLEHFRVV